MVGLDEDPITGDFPSRTQLEEEEEIARDVADQYTIPPSIEFSGDLVDTAIFFLERGTSLLATTLLGDAVAVGSIQVPEVQLLKSPLEEDLGVARPHLNTCTLRTATTGAGGSVLIAECPHVVVPEQANTWAATVLSALNPKSVIIATEMPASRYVGPGSVSDDDLIFSIQTSAAASSLGPSPSPPLPAGNLIDGLPAALLQQCEVSSIPATAFIEVEHSPVPDVQRLCGLGGVVLQELVRVGGVTPEAGQLSDQVKKRIGNVVDNMYRSSVSNSMFI